MPPDQPVIRYVRSIYSEDDIGRVYSLKEKLFGKDYFDRLSRPYGIWASGNKVITADILSKGVILFDLDLRRMSMIGGEALRFPSSAVSDGRGRIYVGDVGTSRIAVYDASGKYRTAFRLNDAKPVALALNETLGILYVVDQKNHRILALDLEGRHQFTIGAPGRGNGFLYMPISIAIGRDHSLYVLDSGNFRVQVLDPRGGFLSKFGQVGDGVGQFASPKGIAVDSDDNVYVTDAAFNNFQVFNRNGDFLLYIGSLGSAPGQLYLPGGIAIDEYDRIYVADQLNRRIQVFQYLKYNP